MLFRGMVRAVRGFHNKQFLGEYIETREELPKVADLNKEIPKEEWDLSDFNNHEPRPPYSFNWVVYLVDESDGATYTSANSTIGQRLAYDELVTKLALDAGKGKHGIPVVELKSKPMAAAGGTTTKQRPFFKVLPDYVDFGGSLSVTVEQKAQVEFDDDIDDINDD
jgi:hypothetical protein